jgi:poly-beta-1,6-N-acetyl-D-glucosamine synthase
MTPYVLVTAAHNEEMYIEKLLRSVIAQSQSPACWVIVSDASTDRTDEIVKGYAARHSFIGLLRMPGTHTRQFAAQIEALNVGFAQMRDIAYEFIGNLDADISLDPDYFARLLEIFDRDPALGLAGGVIYEQRDGVFQVRRSNTLRSVALGVQMFRRTCFEALGGYVPLRYGGPDWHAEVRARMAGWRVQSFPELKAYHHRATGTAQHLLRYWYSQGFMDFTLGSDPVFELAKLARRIPEKPFLLGAIARLSGFTTAWCRREPRLASADFIRFLRAEQRQRLAAFFRSGAWSA